MNPFLFYLLAERLATDPASGPAEFRTAISRAYYAAYHRGREFLTTLGGTPGFFSFIKEVDHVPREA